MSKHFPMLYFTCLTLKGRDLFNSPFIKHKMDDTGDQLARVIAQSYNFMLYDHVGVMEERSKKLSKLALHSLGVNKIKESLIPSAMHYLTSKTAKTIGLSDQAALYCAFRPLCATFVCNSVVVKNDVFSSRATVWVEFVGIPSTGKSSITSLMKKVVLIKHKQAVNPSPTMPSLGDMEFKPSTLKGLLETLKGNGHSICGFPDEFSSVYSEISKDPGYLNQLTSITDGLPVSASVSVYDAKKTNSQNEEFSDATVEAATYSNVNLVTGAQPAIAADIVKRNPASGLPNRLRAYYLQFTEHVAAEDGAKSFFEAYVVICLVLFEISKSSISGTRLEYRLSPECGLYVKQMEDEVTKMRKNEHLLEYSEFEHAEASKRLGFVPGLSLVDHLLQIILETWGFRDVEFEVLPPVDWESLAGASDEYLIRQADILVPRVLSHKRLHSIGLSSLQCADEFRRKFRNDMSILLGDPSREVLEAAENAGVIPKQSSEIRVSASPETVARFKKLKSVLLLPGRFISQNILSHRGSTCQSFVYPFNSLMSISTCEDVPKDLLMHFEQTSKHVSTKFAFKAYPPDPRSLDQYSAFSLSLAKLGITVNEYAAAHSSPSPMWKQTDVVALRKFLASDCNEHNWVEGPLVQKEGKLMLPVPPIVPAPFIADRDPAPQAASGETDAIAGLAGDTNADSDLSAMDEGDDNECENENDAMESVSQPGFKVANRPALVLAPGLALPQILTKKPVAKTRKTVKNSKAKLVFVPSPSSVTVPTTTVRPRRVAKPKVDLYDM
ncbi:hypothetical protein BDR26DRAFT_999897 [Obelidium mucronatum]|nr:hypothetical protein BDR26DRAFT_999897 [Obelidium mucronatum]